MIVKKGVSVNVIVNAVKNGNALEILGMRIFASVRIRKRIVAG
jgi:hypothetical protein